MKRSISTIMGVLVFLPVAAFAHIGVGETSGFVHGFSHPFVGLDHLLAMFTVGLWATQMGGRAVRAVPSACVGVMILGGVLGFAGVPVPFIEGGILASVLILGFLVAGALRFPVLYSALLVGLFALFHGHAHGSEMPAAVGAVAYTIGFVLATATLNLIGIALGKSLQQAHLQTVTRFAGAGVLLAGIYLVIVAF